MEIKYNNKLIKNDEFLTPLQAKNMPNIKIENLGFTYYTLIMYDPDAIHGNHWHWIVMNAKSGNVKKQDSLIDYNGPNPPDAKIHRYIFELYGSNQKYIYPKQNTFSNREISLIKGKELLNLKRNPLISFKFLSKRQTGGKTKKRRINKNRTRKMH